MALKKLRVEDVVLGFIVSLALLYPGIIAFIIYKSDKSEESLKPIVEYLQSQECSKEGPEGIKVRDMKSLMAVCQKINSEGYKLRDSRIEEDKVVLTFGKKVKGMERKLTLSLELEGDEVKSVSYEEGD
ncbi:hypothetical protein [Thermocrinis sp.]